MVRLILFFVFVLVISAAIFAGQRVGEWPGPGSGSDPENTAAALIGGPFTLTDQHGNVVTESILGDRWSVIYFGYTFCPDVCPVTLQNVSLAIEGLGGRGDRVQPIFISVDPWRDTPEVMEFYAAGKPVIVDPKSAEFARYRGATVLTPNAAELAAATGMATAGDEAVEDAARAALDITGADAVVVTRAGEGLSVVQASDARHIRARAREVFDVSGAGDTVAAVIAIGLAAGGSIEDAADLANVAAGIVVGKLGTAVVRRDELLAVLLESGAKTVTLAGAVEHAQRWRKDGHAIAFTNGCFDLIHPGHVSLLRQARAAAGRLIVGLNRDESVRRLKGNARPVQAEAARAAVLSSFAAVDLVVPFAEDTPVSLIEAIRPDVLVKGADYTEKTVVGADLVRSWGGRVLLAEIEPGESSSGIVMRISARDGSASG